MNHELQAQILRDKIAIVDWEDIDYRAVLTPVLHEGGVMNLSFQVYRVVSWDDAPYHPVKSREAGGNDWTTDRENAEVFMEGYIKWDGCCNVGFPATENGSTMLHFCSRDNAKAMGVIMDRLYSVLADIRDDDDNYLA